MMEACRTVTVKGEDSFLYLDMEMFWSKRGELQFRVHLKANQQLKYLTQCVHPNLECGYSWCSSTTL